MYKRQSRLRLSTSCRACVLTLRLGLCMHVCMCVCMYVCVYVCVYCHAQSGPFFKPPDKDDLPGYAEVCVCACVYQ
jgi:hypothetical protein